MALYSSPTPPTFPSLQPKHIFHHTPLFLHQASGRGLLFSVVRADANNAVSVAAATKFSDPGWVGGTWDLEQFRKGGETDWDAVIDADGFDFAMMEQVGRLLFTEKCM